MALYNVCDDVYEPPINIIFPKDVLLKTLEELVVKNTIEPGDFFIFEVKDGDIKSIVLTIVGKSIATKTGISRGTNKFSSIFPSESIDGMLRVINNLFKRFGKVIYQRRLENGCYLYQLVGKIGFGN